MSLFNKTLQSINKKIKEDNSYKKEIQLKLENILKIKIKEDNFFIKNKVLIINTSPTIKMTILLKKDLIINEFLKSNINVINIQ